MSQPNIDNQQRNPSERVCIQTKKVFDACLKQISSENTLVTLTAPKLTKPVAPLEFNSGKSTTTSGIITNLKVSRLPDKKHCARVECDTTIPVEIAYTDARNEKFNGVGNITVHNDVILFIPEASIIPYQVEAVVSTVCPEGHSNGITTYDDESVVSFSVDSCITVILKIVMDVELIIPAYGYAIIPPCINFASEVCNGFFDLPLYPDSKKE